MDMLFTEGLDNVFHRHRLLAEAVRRAVDSGGEGQAIGFNIVEPSRALRHGHRRADEQRPQSRGAARLLQRKCGVILGHGIGDLSGKAFRVAQWATSMRR